MTTKITLIIDNPTAPAAFGQLGATGVTFTGLFSDVETA